MAAIQAFLSYLMGNWVQIGVSLWLIEQALRILTKITPFSWDDNLVDVLSKFLSSIFPKKTP